MDTGKYQVSGGDLQRADRGKRRSQYLVIGSGVFGLPAAIELARRGNTVALVDSGPFPNPLAASNDPSRLVRADYGSDGFYRDLMLAALSRWRDWNARWRETVFHEDGLLVSTEGPFAADGFEAASLASLQEVGRHPPLLSVDALTGRFPAWRNGRRQGYFNALGGWAEAGLALLHLLREAKDAGVVIVSSPANQPIESNGRICGVIDLDGVQHQADFTLLAAGAWTPKRLVNWFGSDAGSDPAGGLTVTGHPLLYFQLPPERTSDFQPPRFVPWTADISGTGWYGFPALADGRLKIGSHGPGRSMDPDDPRQTTPADEVRARAFLSANLPAAADAPLVHSRLCLYCDSPDGDFLVDHHPELPGLVVASGDSGHGFKFAPVLGEIVADVVEGKPNRWAERWAWRAGPPLRREESRWVGESGKSGTMTAPGSLTTESDRTMAPGD